MEIASIRHKALRRFFEAGNVKGLDGNFVERLGRMLALLNDARTFDDLAVPPNYGLHPLSGDRAGTWAMTVSRNWRLTFVKVDDVTVAEIDMEDYH